MVEAAGVEPDISVENTQFTDSENANNSSNATIAKSSLQITCKDFPELQNFQVSPSLAQHAEVLFDIYTSIGCRQNDWGLELLPGIGFAIDSCFDAMEASKIADYGRHSTSDPAE